MQRFTKSKTMVFPREIIVGHNVTSQIDELCDRMGSGNRALIVEDKKTKKLSGEEKSWWLRQKLRLRFCLLF